MIEVLAYERANKNKIIGYVDVKLSKWGFIIRHIPHFQNGDKKWFTLPCYSKEEPDGKYKYFPYIQFETANHNTKFLEILADKVKEYCSKNNIAEPKALNLDEEIPF